MNRQNIYPYSKKYCFEELMLLQQKRQPPPAAQCHRQEQAAFSLYIAITSKRLVYSFISQQGHMPHQPISISRERFSPLVLITLLYQ